MQRKIIITKLDYDTGFSTSPLDEIIAAKHSSYQVLREYLLRNQYAGCNKNEVSNDLAVTTCIEYLSQYPHDALIPYILGTLFYVKNDLILGHFYLAKSLDNGNDSIRAGAGATLAAICFKMLQSDIEKLELTFLKNKNISDEDKNKLKDRLNYYLFILHYENDKTKAMSFLEKVSQNFTEFKITDLILVDNVKKRDEITYDIYSRLVKVKQANKALEFLKNITDVSCFQKNVLDVFELLNPDRKNIAAYEEKKTMVNKICSNKSTAKSDVYALAEKVRVKLDNPKTVIRYKFVKIISEIKEFHKKINPGLTDGIRGLTSKRNEYIRVLNDIEIQLAYSDTKENLQKCHRDLFNLLNKSEYPIISNSANVIGSAKSQLISLTQLILKLPNPKKMNSPPSASPIAPLPPETHANALMVNQVTPFPNYYYQAQDSTGQIIYLLAPTGNTPSQQMYVAPIQQEQPTTMSFQWQQISSQANSPTLPAEPSQPSIYLPFTRYNS